MSVKRQREVNIGHAQLAKTEQLEFMFMKDLKLDPTKPITKVIITNPVKR